MFWSDWGEDFLEVSSLDVGSVVDGLWDLVFRDNAGFWGEFSFGKLDSLPFLFVFNEGVDLVVHPFFFVKPGLFSNLFLGGQKFLWLA